ncbi:MAG: DUF1294 domain-containing protein [Agathobacter sp.]|uniref:DUF1294 domain-containing protein n=1 Tax=Agathobacter sp. TaxID=2021311 RepID=UPI002590BD59|nr:DUF1294 domain-containing protein [Agathobacter sp.]MCR5677148.1 DUF1294 domain-containing protein [Agathobacter sp.]
MSLTWKIIFGYLILMNLAGFVVMGVDKHRSIVKKWRIPEKVLFFFSLLGGSFGTVMGMQIFRHKTRHWYFVIFMPVILALHIVVLIFCMAHFGLS